MDGLTGFGQRLAQRVTALSLEDVVLWLLALAVVALLWRALQRRRSNPTDGHDVRKDKFASTGPINEDQIAVLHYLQSAFPEGAVLFRPTLGRFLAVRKSQNRKAALHRLSAMEVDFLICDGDGQPWFAFEIDAFNNRGDDERAALSEEKNQVLKTAGIRLMRLKGSAYNLPPPEVMRMRMVSARRKPQPEAPTSGFSPSAFGTSRFPTTALQTQLPTSDVMSLSRLMDKDDNGDSPWGDVRKRS